MNKIFEAIDEGREELQKAKKHSETTVLISFRSATMLATDIVSEILSSNPDIKITLAFNPPNGHLSISCSWRKDCEKNQIKLLHEVLKIALPPNHPLGNKKILTIEDVSSLEFILPTPDNPIYDVIVHYADLMNIKINAVMHVQNPDLLCSFVKSKSCAAFIPTLTWKKFHIKNVTLHDVENFVMDKYIYLTYREQDKDNSVVRTCCEIIVEFFSNIQKELNE